MHGNLLTSHDTHASFHADGACMSLETWFGRYEGHSKLEQHVNENLFSKKKDERCERKHSFLLFSSSMKQYQCAQLLHKIPLAH